MVEAVDKMELKRRLEMCIRVLNEYSWLLDSYILDFFTENHIKKLPKAWRNYLKHIQLEEFHYLLTSGEKIQTVWPLSIICLKTLIQFLQLPRKPFKSDPINLIQSNKINCTELYESSRFKSACFEHQRLRNYFLTHVKPKKRYEIFKMATIIAETANELNVQYVVDFGSGLGHLSRIMAYGFNLKVCSIENQSQLTEQAFMMDCEFEKIASRYLNESDFQHVKTFRPVHLNQTIKFNLTAEDFLKNLKEAFSLTGKDFTFGIVGLHPCGNLAAVLLKLYTDCSEARFINLVGCCYHKLSTSGDSTSDRGFPLSDYCTSKRPNISYEARALACHAIETYCERLISKNCHHLKIHCYRATLENIIKKNWPTHRKSALGNVKPLPELTFIEYCQTALKKLKLCVSEKDLNSEETLRNLSDWEDVVKFYSLRLMLAPLIETLVLLDRKIYLLEKGFQCKIKAAFDPEISPRNQLLISLKSI